MTSINDPILILEATLASVSPLEASYAMVPVFLLLRRVRSFFVSDHMGLGVRNTARRPTLTFDTTPKLALSCSAVPTFFSFLGGDCVLYGQKAS